MPSQAGIAFRKAAKRAIGRRGVAVVRALRGRVNAVIYRGEQFYCPVCRSRLRAWLRTADAAMTDAECPVCGSLGRHRFLWLMLERTGLWPGSSDRVLHFAPEWILERKLLALTLGRGYLSGDLVPGRAMRVLDITDLELPDASIDWILCSHVLEHIPDDRRAIAEMARVLRSGGRLLVQVPIRDIPTTIEDTGDSCADTRTERFGLYDHVRLYGLDLTTRLATQGLAIEVWDPTVEFQMTEFERCALDMAPNSGRLYTAQSRVYCCVKPFT